MFDCSGKIFYVIVYTKAGLTEVVRIRRENVCLKTKFISCINITKYVHFLCENF